MASLTDQLAGVNSGKQIVNPGPASPSGLGALADFASKAIPGLARLGEERAAARKEGIMDEAAGRIFDIQTGANRPMSTETPSAPEFVNSGPVAFDSELAGAPIPQDAVSAANDVARAQRGVQQGRVSQATYDMQLERLQADLFNKYPDQRAELAAYFQSRGLEHYMFRAFKEEKAAYDNEQAAKMASDRTQFDYAASRGLVTSNTNLEDGARIGRDAMAAQAEMERAKADAAAAIENRNLNLRERESALKDSSGRAVNSVITQIGQSVQPLMDATNLALASAGSDAERQTTLSGFKTQTLAALAAAEQRAYLNVAAAGGDKDARDAVSAMFKGYRDSVETLYTSSFTENTNALKNMEASFGVTAGRAAPMYSRMVALLGQPAANALFADPLGLQQMAPEVIANVKKEMLAFDPTSERGTVSLARMIGYMRGDVNLKDLNPTEAAQYVRANGAALNANQVALLGGDTTALRGWQPNYGNMTEAMVELGPTTTSAASLKTATGFVSTPAARRALEIARREDPEYGNALTQASRAAAAKGLEIGRGLPESAGPFKSRYNEQTGRFEATLSQVDYNNWRRGTENIEGVSAAFGAAPGLASGQHIPSYDEMRRQVPPELRDKLITMNANLDHLIQTDQFDPAIPSSVSPRERRALYVNGTVPESMRKTNAEGVTETGEWDRARGNLNTQIQSLISGVTSQALPVNFNQLWSATERQESRGDQSAVSSKGAFGVAQLMPETAAQVARELGDPSLAERAKTDPAINRQLGQYYLQQQLDEFDNVPEMALAAYNAGPGRVREWIRRFGDPRTGAISASDWARQIPFKETNDYVRIILGNARG